MSNRVVVVFDVVDDLARRAGVAGGLTGIVDLRQRPGFAGRRLHRIIAQRAGEADADKVGRAHQVGTRGAIAGMRVRRIKETVEVTLPREQVRAAVAAAAAAYGIAGAVAEGGDAAAGQRELRGLHEARAIGDFTEVPAFAEQDHVPAARRIRRRLHGLHRHSRLVAHEIEAE
jgi:hypothetical protein